jgi:hypothetical protein
VNDPASLYAVSQVIVPCVPPDEFLMSKCIITPAVVGVVGALMVNADVSVATIVCVPYNADGVIEAEYGKAVTRGTPERSIPKAAPRSCKEKLRQAGIRTP